MTDIVFLKSGSPPLRVEFVDDDGVHVVWTGRDLAVQRHVFPVRCLRFGSSKELN